MGRTDERSSEPVDTAKSTDKSGKRRNSTEPASGSHSSSKSKKSASSSRTRSESRKRERSSRRERSKERHRRDDRHTTRRDDYGSDSAEARMPVLNRHGSQSPRYRTNQVSLSDPTPSTSRHDVDALLARIAQLERAQRSPAYSFTDADIDPQLSSTLKDLDGIEDGEIAGANADPLCDNSLLANICPKNNGADDLLNILDEGLDNKKKGPLLGTSAKHLVRNWFETETDNSTIKSIIDRYPVPEQCSELSGKQINAEIYRNLSTHAKKRDFRLKSTQSAVATAAIANLRLIDTLTGLFENGQLTRETTNLLLQFSSDATKLLAKGYADLSLIRKSLLRPNIQTKYQQLCQQRTYGETLFGSDLTKDVKSIDDNSKIVFNMTRTQTQNYGQQIRAHPYVDTRPSKNGYPRGRGWERPHYPQYNQYTAYTHYNQFRGGKRATRGRGKAPLASPSRNHSVQQ